MRMRAAELRFAIHAERVVPDHPTANVEADLLRLDLQFGRVFIADGQPERAVWLQSPMHGLNPVARPGQIMVVLLGVMINVVLVANIEGRIGEDQINRAGGQRVHLRDAITVMNPAEEIAKRRASHEHRP